MKIVQLNSLSSLKKEIKIFCSMTLLVLVVFLLAACAGNNDGGGAGVSVTGDTITPDACTLLSAADVETVLGSSVSTIGEVDEEGFFSTCTWIDESSGARLSINIWGAGNAEDGWATQFVSAQAAADYNEPIENLGEEAYANNEGASSNYIWRVDDAFVVIFTSAGSETSEDFLFELAKKIDSSF